MLETLCLLFGLGYSFLIYFRSIRPLDQPRSKKLAYFFFTLLGVTGTLFLFGVLVAHFMRTGKFFRPLC